MGSRQSQYGITQTQESESESTLQIQNTLLHLGLELLGRREKKEWKIIIDLFICIK